MRILQLIPNILGGGAERFTVDLSNSLSADNDVSLLTLYDSQDNDLFREDLNNSISTYSVGKELGFDYKIFTRLYNTIKRISPDVIHTHLRSINYVMPLYPLLPIPLVHTVHSDAFEECSNNLIRASRKMLFKSKNAVPVTISEQSRQSFGKAYNGTYSELIYNGRAYPHQSSEHESALKDIAKLKSDDNTNVFIHIGRIQKEKNQLMLVKAFNRLVYEKNANAILLIIGDGRNRQIQQQLQQVEQEHVHIHLLGERANATDYLHAADYFCLSSLYEGMPITLIEAFATGCIPVCTPVGGIPEMVEELDDSLLAESVNEDDYVEALKNALDILPDKQKELKNQAVSLFERKYSIKHCTEKYLNIYNSMLFEN